jgi:excisionase family DNA binding protein
VRNQGKAVTPRQSGTAGSVQSPKGHPAAMPAIVPGSQLLFRVTEAREMLSLGKNEMYKELRNGRIRSVGKGRGRRIPASALLEYIDLLESEEAKRQVAARKLAAARSPRPKRPTLGAAAVKEAPSEQENR